MPGFFNNETGCYEDVEWLRDGDWFVDDDEQLYIVPGPEVVAEIEGPDNVICAELTRLAREQGSITDADCARLGLQRIFGWQKRFGPINGYYHC